MRSLDPSSYLDRRLIEEERKRDPDAEFNAELDRIIAQATAKPAPCSASRAAARPGRARQQPRPLSVAGGAVLERGQDQAADDGSPKRRRSRVVWKELLTADFGTLDWLPGGLMVKGQFISLVGEGKAGKSLFCQDWAWRLAAGQPFLGKTRDPLRVLYLDRENGHGDLQERFLALGADMDVMDDRLMYESFPEDIPPLDTPAGGAVLAAVAEDAQADVVFIDTISRFVQGPENDSDTYLAAYRNSIVHLKARGISVIRLDHFGKDTDRGARGSNAKTQDIDHVWELSAAGDDLLRLRRTHTRTGHGKDMITIQRHGEKLGNDDDAPWAPGKTRHELAVTSVSSPVRDLIRRLDEAGIPKNLGRARVREEAERHDIPLPGNSALAEALRIRKAGVDLPSLDARRQPTAVDPFEESA